MQQKFAHFEERVVRAIQSAWQTFDEWQSQWISFSARSDHLLDPETPLRNLETINYPSKENPSVIPVHTGYLERKKRFTRTYRESYFVLTPSGFLHEYSSSDPAQAASPLFSLFLPLYTLGPVAGSSAKSHKFHIEGCKDGAGWVSAHRAPRAARGEIPHALTRGYDGMVERRPVAAAVRAAGYVSEEEEEGEEESSNIEEGSTLRRRRKCSCLARTATMHDGPGDEDTEPPSYRRHPHGVSEPATPVTFGRPQKCTPPSPPSW
ncbi:hypothetical protein EDB85DRAFT_2150997 [Lactarius pseudohatsudake]|nr:hypothetical protein EDB85DRAFT_2150997 [Lactarius pseudohatsudake]